MSTRVKDIIKQREVVDESTKTSEIRYRRLFESARDGILILDVLTHKITDANPFMVELLGYDHNEFIGKELWEIGLLKDEKANKEAFQELLEEGYIRYEDLPLETEKGACREIEFISNIYTEGDRQVIQCNIRDITERKANENAVVKLKDDLELAVIEYQRVLDNSLDVICQMNEVGRFIQVSAAAKKVWGYEPEELIASDNSINFVHPDDQDKTRQALIDVMTGHPTSTFENRYLRKDGTVASMMWSANWSEDDKTFCCVARDISKIKQAEEAARISDSYYRSLVESSPAIVFLSSPDPPYTSMYVSPNIEKFGYSVDEWFDNPEIWSILIHPDDRERVLKITNAAMNNSLDFEVEYRIIARYGRIHWLHVKGSFIYDGQENKIAWQGLMLEITKTKELEDQLRQSQKLESVGRLAGGIAHDFNNMLTVIIGYSDSALRSIKEDDPTRNSIEEIKKAGQRSAALTYQLLAFSRQQMLQPKILSINQIISDISTMLERLIGEDIQLITILNPKVGLVEVDPGQFSQIIMNLAVNSGDAMPHGGKLTFETLNVTLDEYYARRNPGVFPGEYVMLAVSDTGIGMSAKTQTHIFEPFFTTKPLGEGTGLGLSTVYGIVQQSGGNIYVYSMEGVGTTFKIYLPRVKDPSIEKNIPVTADELPMGTETILLVEDDEMVRSFTKHLLEIYGYKIITAANGVEALSILEKQDCRADLLMTDVVMPQMGGRELSEKVAEIFPDMEILFTSGYTDDAVVRNGIIEASRNFIQKPFSTDGLIRKIRFILDGRQVD